MIPTLNSGFPKFSVHHVLTNHFAKRMPGTWIKQLLWSKLVVTVKYNFEVKISEHWKKFFCFTFRKLSFAMKKLTTCSDENCWLRTAISWKQQNANLVKMLFRLFTIFDYYRKARSNYCFDMQAIAFTTRSILYSYITVIFNKVHRAYKLKEVKHPAKSGSL